jgi:hypothetical protein
MKAIECCAYRVIGTCVTVGENPDRRRHDLRTIYRECLGCIAASVDATAATLMFARSNAFDPVIAFIKTPCSVRKILNSSAFMLTTLLAARLEPNLVAPDSFTHSRVTPSKIASSSTGRANPPQRPRQMKRF